MLNNFTLHNGNSAEVLKRYPDNYFDSVVTDPPYGIDFLGKEWDANTGALEIYQECLRVLKPGGHLLAFSAARTYHHLAYTVEVAGFEIRDQIMWLYSSGFPKSQSVGSGWGTALKPAHEPIVMARKPMKLSAKKNMLEHGVGGINVEESRVLTNRGQLNGKVVDGAFPNNVLGHVEGYEKYFYSPKISRAERHIGYDVDSLPTTSGGKYDTEEGPALGRQDIWKDGNNHPTVKPQALMEYLIKLVTPPNSRVLDPFNGSGSTGMAAVKLGHTYVGIDLDPAYIEISRKRITAWNTPGTVFDSLFTEDTK